MNQNKFVLTSVLLAIGQLAWGAADGVPAAKPAAIGFSIGGGTAPTKPNTPPAPAASAPLPVSAPTPTPAPAPAPANPTPAVSGSSTSPDLAAPAQTPAQPVAAAAAPPAEPPVVAPAAVAPTPAKTTPATKPATDPLSARWGTVIQPESPTDTEPRLQRGTGVILAPTLLPPALDSAPTSFSFEDAPIQDVVNVLMRDILHVDFLIHPPLTGTVTLATRTNVTTDQAVYLLESVLQGAGLQMVRDPRGVYHVGKPEALKGIGPSVRHFEPGKPLQPGSGVIIVPLDFIGATEMAAILKPMLPPDALVRTDTLRNLLVLVGSRTQAEGWLDLVRTFDVNLLKGMSIGMFPLKYITTKEVESTLKLLAGSTGNAASGGAAGSSAPTAPAAPTMSLGAAIAAGGLGGAASNSAPGSSGGVSEPLPLFGAIRVMTVERLNAILVVTPRAAYLDEARQWIESIDKPGLNGGEPQLFVYPVQNGSAKHLASVISGLFGGNSSAISNNNTGVAPGLTSSTAGSTILGSTGSGPGNTAFGSSTFGSSTGSNFGRGTVASNGSAAGGVTAVALGNSGVRLISDDLNNAILVWGTRAEFAKIEAALKRLDVPPTQVLIEASIIEVTLNDSLSYGLQWALSGGVGGGKRGSSVLSSAADGTIATAAQGFTYTLTNAAGNVQAVLNALAGESLLKVISSPSLMVLDNHTANISVGTQQPVQSATTVTTGGVVSNSIQYKDTGVNLTVTPSVNAGNMVTMELQQTVTDVGAAIDKSTGQLPFNQRQITSKVAVRSGENIVLGGLIRDNNSSGSSGLPLLSSLPIVGGLFGSKNSSTARTELLVVLTPRVVRSDQEIRDVSEEMRDKLKGLSGFSTKALGGTSSGRAPLTQSTSTLK
jgi:general secretion pathway protein D